MTRAVYEPAANNRHKPITFKKSAEHKHSNPLRTNAPSSLNAVRHEASIHLKRQKQEALEAQKKLKDTPIELFLESAAKRGFQILALDTNTVEFLEFRKNFPTSNGNNDGQPLQRVVVRLGKEIPNQPMIWPQEIEGVRHVILNSELAKALLLKDPSAKETLLNFLHLNNTHLIVEVLKMESVNIINESARINKEAQEREAQFRLTGHHMEEHLETQIASRKQIDILSRQSEEMLSKMLPMYENMLNRSGIKTRRIDSTRLELLGLKQVPNHLFAFMFQKENHKKRKQLEAAWRRLKSKIPEKDFHVIFDIRKAMLEYGGLSTAENGANVVGGQADGKQNVLVGEMALFELMFGKTGVLFHEIRHLIQTRKKSNPLLIWVSASFPMKLEKINDHYSGGWRLDEINSYGKSGVETDLERARDFHRYLKKVVEHLEKFPPYDFTFEGEQLILNVFVQKDGLPGAEKVEGSLTLKIPLSNDKIDELKRKGQIFEFAKKYVKEGLKLSDFIMEKQERRQLIKSSRIQLN